MTANYRIKINTPLPYSPPNDAGELPKAGAKDALKEGSKLPESKDEEAPNVVVELNREEDWFPPNSLVEVLTHKVCPKTDSDLIGQLDDCTPNAVK